MADQRSDDIKSELNQSQPIKVVLADDHELVRAGIAAIVGAEPDIQVVGQASDGGQVVDLVNATGAQVVLMDVLMPKVDGITGLQRLQREHPQVAVLMLTTFNIDEHIENALRAGASGYLLKTAPAEELVAAIKAAAAGQQAFSTPVQERLVASYLGQNRAQEPPAVLDRLTDRELDVFHELARGKSNSEIAETLFLSEATVKTYVTRILSKLELRDRVQAVVFAFKHGLTDKPG